MIEIRIKDGKATATGTFKASMLNLFNGIRGKKLWGDNKTLTFEATQFNVDLIKNSEFEYPGEFRFIGGVEPKVPHTMATQHEKVPPLPKDYVPKLPLWKLQKDILGISWLRKVYAVLLEMSLGKSAIIITNAGMLHVCGKVTGVLILSPRGVHIQWIDEQIPLHLSDAVKGNLLLWKKKPIDVKLMNKKGLTFLSMNVDAIRTKIGWKTAEAFLKMHNGKSMMVVDESHLIKSPGADRTKAAIKLGALATYRRICTGTPIAKTVIDAWSQFMFLDKTILNHPYMTSFRARFCIMGGFEGRVVVGQKNVEEFYSLIAPHSFRMTKLEALDLPPKIYVTREYEMGEETERHYKSMKNTFMTELENGEILDVENAAVAILRLQQIVCGYLPILEDADIHQKQEIEIISDERIDILMDIVEQVQGPVIVWARFIADIRRIEYALQKRHGINSCVTYFGETSNAHRKYAKEAFLSGQARFFISNPAAGGTGLNLQGDCQTVIYYSNSFDALHRWQSEDRTHRPGMKGTITYFDIVASRSVDKRILQSLKNKKSISHLTFDQIRSFLSMT